MQSQRQARRFGGTSPAAESRVLKLKGLPYSTREADLQDFFRDYRIAKAFAEFESSEEAVRALAARNGDYIGDRYVKMLRVPHEEMEEQTGALGRGCGGLPAAAFGQEAFGGAVGGSAPQQPLQGFLPQPASAAGQWGQVSNGTAGHDAGFAAAAAAQGFAQVQQGFSMRGGGAGWDPMNGPQPFSGYNYYAQQGGSGGGFAGGQQQGGFFPGNGLGGMPGQLGPWVGNGAGAAAAHPPISLPADMGEKPIAVLIAEQQAAIREGQRSAAQAAPSYQQAAMAVPSSMPGGGMHVQGGGIQSSSMPPGAGLSMQGSGGMPGGSGFSGRSMAGNSGLHPGGGMPSGSGGRPGGGGLPGSSVGPAASGPQLGMGMGMAALHGQHSATPSPPAQAQANQQAPQHSSMAGAFGAAMEAQQQSKQRIVKTDGSTIKIRGLPFRATPEEILSFFDGYALVGDSLFLGSDARGRPSGEGWLTLQTPEEAVRAARDKNRQYMGSRYLELSLC